jgi:hypothetical protein
LVASVLIRKLSGFRKNMSRQMRQSGFAIRSQTVRLLLTNGEEDMLITTGKGRYNLAFMTEGNTVWRGAKPEDEVDGEERIWAREMNFPERIVDFVWIGGNEGKALIQTDDRSVWARQWDRSKKVATWTQENMDPNMVPRGIRMDNLDWPDKEE